MAAGIGRWCDKASREEEAGGCPLRVERAETAALIELHLPFGETSRTASARDTHTIGACGRWQADEAVGAGSRQQAGRGVAG